VRRKALAALLAAALLGACTVPAPPEPWQSKFDADHALVGKIYDVRAASFVRLETLVSRLIGADIVILGEKHDNTDHQRLASRIVSELVPSKRPTSVGFEVLTSDRQAALDAGVAPSGRGFAPYARIAETARGHDLRIVALNAPDTMVRDARTRGLGSLDSVLAQRLGLDRALPEAQYQAIAKDMRDSHCGMLPETAIPGMVAVQRLWDAHMAERAAAAIAKGGLAILIVGGNHARKDLGIPASLSHVAPTMRSASVLFAEVSINRRTPEEHAKDYEAPALPFDFVWFTPRASNADPCAAFRRRTS